MCSSLHSLPTVTAAAGPASGTAAAAASSICIGACLVLQQLLEVLVVLPYCGGSSPALALSVRCEGGVLQQQNTTI